MNSDFLNADFLRYRWEFFQFLTWAQNLMVVIRRLVGPEVKIEPGHPLHDGVLGFLFRVWAPDDRPLLVLVKGRDVWVRDEWLWQGEPERPEAVDADTRYIGHPQFWDWLQGRLRRYGFELVPHDIDWPADSWLPLDPRTLGEDGPGEGEPDEPDEGADGQD
jgi:hypothetical protein